MTVPLPAGHGDTVQLWSRSATPPTSTRRFRSIRCRRATPSTRPAIGLLGVSDDALLLGHWFPVWVPDGLDVDPDLDGFGDISNFPAARIHAILDVPADATVVTSGARLDEQPGEEGRVIITEGAAGLRDLSVVVMPTADQVEVAAGDVTVVVSAPAGTADLDAVAEVAATSVSTLSSELGGVPVGRARRRRRAARLRGRRHGVAGHGVDRDDGVRRRPARTRRSRHRPGARSTSCWALMYSGEDSELGDLFGIGDMGLMLDTMREWTIAHEVGHMWWHALVGNDSITSPVVDEALAQHSACLVERVLRPADADEVCDINTSGQFEQLVSLMGVVDGPADQSTDDFASSTQYGALVYGKAPVFYRALEAQYGVSATTAALAAVVDEYAFDQITSDQLRDALGQALGDPTGVDELWQRWIEEAHGSDDLTD